MYRSGPHAFLSNKPGRSAGLTLMEMLVTLAILSILASAAMPYAEITVKRNREVELKRALREIRTAIDRFHADWQDGKVAKMSGVASINGYPKQLQHLVDGVQLVGVSEKRKYLRRIPTDPMVFDKTGMANHAWLLVSYRDAPDSQTWGGEDVYDVRSSSDRLALDKTRYDAW